MFQVNVNKNALPVFPLD